ncbi:MAG: hypothetical protein C3F13_06110 [Anaerolineales bacterium]|nr:zinc ribbon domain-containing protein [Anaerolineae bacterium]PWB54590.1 MAG: hypothetical protein C3F13_06110 [Anaerolineales bacterium]
MRKWVILLLAIISLLAPISVRAQNPISFSSMFIEIWPEYDKPSVLVIYQITLASSTSFPATLSIRIPTTAGAPNAVAERQADGSLYSINYTRQLEEEWSSINFTTTASAIQIEFYDPSLEINGTSRHFIYTWPGGYAINQLTMQVQQPSGATEMLISPNLGAGANGSDGLTYYTQDIGSITADQSIQITIDYQKATDSLSAQNLPVAPSGPIPQSSISDINISYALPWLLAILGAGLIVGGIVWFWRSGKQKPARKIRRRRSSVDQSAAQTDQKADEESIYCSQCGKRAAPGDQFCRSCGSAIRRR